MEFCHWFWIHGTLETLMNSPGLSEWPRQFEMNRRSVTSWRSYVRFVFRKSAARAAGRPLQQDSFRPAAWATLCRLPLVAPSKTFVGLRIQQSGVRFPLCSVVNFGNYAWVRLIMTTYVSICFGRLCTASYGLWVLYVFLACLQAFSYYTGGSYHAVDRSMKFITTP